MIIKAQLLFHGVNQNMQDLGTESDFMVSRVFFSLQLPDKRIDNLFVGLKLTEGGSYEKTSIEVGKLQGAVGNLDYGTFRDAVEAYYRKLIGPEGRSVKVVGAKNIVMRNNRFDFPMTAEITINTESGGW